MEDEVIKSCKKICISCLYIRTHMSHQMRKGPYDNFCQSWDCYAGWYRDYCWVKCKKLLAKIFLQIQDKPNFVGGYNTEICVSKQNSTSLVCKSSIYLEEDWPKSFETIMIKLKERKHWHWDGEKEKLRHKNWGSNQGPVVKCTRALTTELSLCGC